MASRARHDLLVRRADLRDPAQLDLDRELIDLVDRQRPSGISRSDYVERVLRNALDGADPLGLQSYDAEREVERLWARYLRFMATER
jgi:hypothetical protein